MTKTNDQGRGALDAASERVAEIAALYVRVRDYLQLMLDDIGQPTAATPKPLLNKISELQSVHLKVLAAEEAFYAQQQVNQPDVEIDYDALRADIGRQIDRIRTTLEPS